MSYRRKAPAAASLTLSQQLSKLCNASAGDLIFQSHNAMSLLTQLQKYDSAYYDLFAKNAAMQRFVPAWAVKKNDKHDSARFNLPLPAHFIDAADSVDDFEPRSFYLEKALPGKLGRFEKTVPFPRCGLSGLFFTREEVVDNLQAAATDLQFSSPFWIRKDHPGLQSGYLRVKDGSETIVISLTSSIVGIADVDGIAVDQLHPLLRGTIGDNYSAKDLKVSDDFPLGMNALTGVITKNPYVCQMANRGLWLSQEQLLQHNIKLSRHIKEANGAFKLVEIDQWELFNADQLQVPGRLGLRRSVSSTSDDSLFQPV